MQGCSLGFMACSVQPFAVWVCGLGDLTLPVRLSAFVSHASHQEVRNKKNRHTKN